MTSTMVDAVQPDLSVTDRLGILPTHLPFTPEARRRHRGALRAALAKAVDDG